MTDEELVREVVARARVQSTQRASVRAEQPWLAALGGLSVALLIGLLLLPGPWSERLALIVHGVCAQEHHIALGPITLPLCARNTGIYSGFLSTALLLVALGRGRAAALPPTPITLVLVGLIAAMGIDGTNSLLLDLGAPHAYTPRNDLRTITGLGMGVAVAVFLLFAFNSAIWANQERRQPVLASWAELLAALGLGGLLFGLLYAGPSWLYYPLAVWSVVGIVGVLLLVNMLVVSVATQREETATRLRQLARPATIGLLLTAGQLAVLAWVRLAVEGGLG